MRCGAVWLSHAACGRRSVRAPTGHRRPALCIPPRAQRFYLRTAWQLKSYGDNNDVVIRTRIIVKRSNDQPLRYAIKIVSERNRIAGVSVKDDENFVPWDRLLNTYKDVIGEVQSRLTR